VESPQQDENLFINLGAAVATLMVFYAAGVDLIGLDRQGSRNLFLASLALVFVAHIARSIRLRRLGARIRVKSLGPIRDLGHRQLLFWLIGAALLGAYSCREVIIGSLAVGIVGSLSSISLMIVLALALLRAAGGPGAAA